MATTTNTGAKKIDQSEQWRNILGIHNDTVDAYDEHVAKHDESLAIVSDGNTHGAIASGQYVYVKNHSTLAEGLYTANSAISANATLSSSNVTPVSGGGLNALNSKITTLSGKVPVNGIGSITKFGIGWDSQANKNLLLVWDSNGDEHQFLAR